MVRISSCHQAIQSDPITKFGTDIGIVIRISVRCRLDFGEIDFQLGVSIIKSTSIRITCELQL